MQGRACYSSAQTIPRARPSKWTRPPQSDRADILITRTVAMGDAAEALLVAAAVRDLTVALSLPPGGVKIPRPLVEPLAEYVVTTLKLESVDEFISMGPESAVSCVSSLEDEYPAPYLVALRSWMIASPTAAKSVAASRPRMSRVGFKTMEKVAVDSEDSDGDESVMSSRVAVSRAERDAIKDSKRLGMTPQRITALNTSCYGGLMVGEDEVEGVPYGSDPQTLEFCRKKLKDVVTLPKLLQAKDAAGAKLHLLELTRQYSQEEDCSPEVFCIQGFSTTTEDLFQGDDVGYCKYVQMYMRRFKGRAFPQEHDLFLALKCFRDTSGTASIKSELATLKAKIDKVDKVTSDLAELKSKVNEHKQALNRLENRFNQSSLQVVPGKGGGKGGKGGASIGPCNYCGELGHLQKDCPTKAAAEAPDP